MAARDAEKKHEERMTEGLSEDPAMADILHVVDQPLQAAGPLPHPAGGGGRARYFKSSRGRGRGRGRGPRGQGDFERGDLPPRFRRGLQN